MRFWIPVVLLCSGFFCHAATTQLLSNKRVLICGAGPVGLCTALLFTKEGCTDITIVEKRSQDTPFESAKAYQYLLDGRGQRLTNLLGITPALAANAVSSFLFTNLTEVTTKGKLNTKSLPVDKKAQEKFWLPRSTMLSVLQEALFAANPNVNLLYGTSLTHLLFDAQADSVEATLATRNNTDEEERITRLSGFSLVIGADGINSKVRQYLEVAEEGKFEPRLLQSDSSGLKYKMLTPKLRFPLPDSSVSVPERAYAIRGVSPRIFSPFARLSLGLLPVRGGSYRTANIITKPGHPLFALKTAQEVKQYLQQAFPQLTLSDFVNDDEIERFAKAEAGTFPQPQYLQSFFLSLSNSTHVALAGDALHVFPPDLGQGVNSGLEDVRALGEALGDTGSNKNVGEALVAYEQKRRPEVAALCELMVFGYPYQYRQALLKSMLALANFALRLGLNKLMPSVFAPPAFFLVQDANISMVEIVRRAHDTTRKMFALLFAVIAALDYVAGIKGGGLLAAATRPNWISKIFGFCYLNLALLIAYPRSNKF